MKEVYIAPMTIEGKFHMGRITEVIAADTHTRWQLFTKTTNKIAVVHDSWNTYGPERSKEAYEQREDLITLNKQAKGLLGLLPSADLQVKNGKLSSLTPQEFRDDDPKNIGIVNDALQSLKEKGAVITGIIEGEKGLYLHIDKVLEATNIQQTLEETQIFPPTFKARFKKTLDPTNESNYLGKIPLTKKRSYGLPVDPELLEGRSYHTDQRFSATKSSGDKTDIDYQTCVSPLVVLGLMPYIRNQQSSEEREPDFISNGVGSSVRFNLVSVLLNKSIGIEESYKNIHLFGKLDVNLPGKEQITLDPEWSSKIRYIIFDQLSADHKPINPEFAHVDMKTGILEVPHYELFKKRVTYVKNKSKFEPGEDFPDLNHEERKYLQDLGITQAMNQLDYAKAFRRTKDELVKRSKHINQSISSNDYILIKMVNLFLPNI